MLLFLLVLAGCADDSSICDVAGQHVATCLEQPGPAGPSTCGESEAAVADQLLGRSCAEIQRLFSRQTLGADVEVHPGCYRLGLADFCLGACSRQFSWLPWSSLSAVKCHPDHCECQSGLQRLWDGLTGGWFDEPDEPDPSIDESDDEESSDEH